jgi:hypothetical protein
MSSMYRMVILVYNRGLVLDASGHRTPDYLTSAICSTAANIRLITLDMSTISGLITFRRGLFDPAVLLLPNCRKAFQRSLLPWPATC